MRVPGGAGVLTLTRFWFPVPGHHGVGVTAPSLADAAEMAASVAASRGWALDARLVEQNVDVQRLDPEVVATTRDPGSAGVWFP